MEDKKLVVEEVENPFALEFESYNAYGEKLTEAREEVELCCICGKPIKGYGNNPEPYKHEGSCCDDCNLEFVIPARLAELNKTEE